MLEWVFYRNPHIRRNSRPSHLTVGVEIFGKVEVLVFEFYHVSINTRQIENVVNQSQQDVGVVLDFFYIDGLVGLVMFQFKELGET